MTMFLHEYCHLHRPPPHLRNDEPIDWVEFGTIYSAKFVLEVLGATGAVWGFSEATGLRRRDDHSSVWFWRPVALCIGVVFCFRYWMHGKHYLERHCEFPPIKPQHRHHKKPFLQIFSSKFVLEVVGGGGAIWGSSEALTLRNPDMVWFWRPAAEFVALVFGVTWVLEMVAYCKATEEELHTKTVIRWYKRLFVRFILDVLGGVGAVWGSSEAFALRNADTMSSWRAVAISLGVIFFCRWVWQIKEAFLAEDHQKARYTEVVSPSNETYELALTESVV